MENKKLTFEDCFSRIVTIINFKKSKWKLDSLAWLDYDDIRSILLLHIWKKFELWDQKMPLEPYINRICENQLINIQRNLYYNFSKPCLNCPQSEGLDNFCKLYGTQDASKCKILATWNGCKKNAYNIKLPCTIEHHQNELSLKEDNSSNIFNVIPDFHRLMEDILEKNELVVYRHLYIEHKDQKDLNKILGYTVSNKSAGYKTISNLKKSILDKAKKLLKNNDLDYERD